MEYDRPNVDPNDQPNIDPNDQPNIDPNDQPNIDPNDRPNIEPNDQPNIDPNDQPNIDPNVQGESQYEDKLYKAMKRVKAVNDGKDPATNERLRKDKEIIDQRVELERQKMQSEMDPLNIDTQTQLKQPYRRKYQNIQKDFKNLFNQQHLTSINSVRRCLLHLVIFVIIINCLFWEVLCLFHHTCFGEKNTMVEFISHSICPMIFILLILYMLLFFCCDFLYKPGIKIVNILIIIMMILFLVFGVYGIIKGIKADVNEKWLRMSKLSQDYFKNDENELKKKFTLNMLLSSVIYLVIGLLGIIVLIVCYRFYWSLTETSGDWRPPLRSRLHDDRANRILRLYEMFIDEKKRVEKAEKQPGSQFDNVGPISNASEIEREREEIERKRKEEEEERKKQEEERKEEERKENNEERRNPDEEIKNGEGEVKKKKRVLPKKKED